jgi:hypothetical protein
MAESLATLADHLDEPAHKPKLKSSRPATLDDINELIALVRESKGIDSLVPDPQVRAELGGIS